MNIVLNEYKYALEILEKHIIGNKPSETLSVLARYYRYKENKNDSEIYDLLNQHMESYYPNYNPVKWSITLDSQVKKSKKYPLIEIDSVPMTAGEIQAISQLHNIRMERVAFTLLACAKFANLRNAKNNNWVNKEHKEIFKLARANMTIIQQCEMIYDLKESGYIGLSNKVDNLNIKVNYIDDTSDVVIELKDFRELGYEYMLYLGNKYIRCEKCGRLVNPKGTRKKYCAECSEYQPIEYKTIKCIDCGCEVVINSLDTKSLRCRDCQSKINKERKREINRRYYNNNNKN